MIDYTWGKWKILCLLKEKNPGLCNVDVPTLLIRKCNHAHTERENPRNLLLAYIRQDNYFFQMSQATKCEAIVQCDGYLIINCSSLFKGITVTVSGFLLVHKTESCKIIIGMKQKRLLPHANTSFPSLDLSPSSQLAFSPGVFNSHLVCFS